MRVLYCCILALHSKYIMNRNLIISPYLLWAFILVGAGVAFVTIPDRRLFFPTFLDTVIFLLAVIVWLFCFLGAITVNRHVASSVAGVREIVTHGVYRIVRHPIYTGDLILAWGFFVFHPTIRVLFAVAWWTVVLIVWMRLEDSGLRERFGEAYEAYSRRVPGFIPFLHHHSH